MNSRKGGVVLRGIDYGACFLASGSLNFDGKGWRYDRIWSALFPGFGKVIKNTCFVAKTTTEERREGNLPLDDNLQPTERFIPKCIAIRPFLGYAFNAVGLSGPGIQSLIDRGFWEYIERAFFVSLAAVKETTIEQLGEIKRMVEILRPNIIFYDRRLGVQLNVSCPNVEEKDPSEGDIKDLTERTLGMLEIVHSLGLPVDLKINVSMPIEVIKAVEHSGLCDMITLSNTIKYGTKNTQIDWRAVEPSPLAHLGGGGLSGSIILSSVLKRIAQLRNEGVKIFIKGSGGVMSASDVDLMKEAGADAIEIASVLMLRPWRVAGVVKRSKIVFAK